MPNKPTPIMEICKRVMCDSTTTATIRNNAKVVYEQTERILLVHNTCVEIFNDYKNKYTKDELDLIDFDSTSVSLFYYYKEKAKLFEEKSLEEKKDLIKIKLHELVDIQIKYAHKPLEMERKLDLVLK